MMSVKPIPNKPQENNHVTEIGLN